jgi:hypothetical protein
MLICGDKSTTIFLSSRGEFHSLQTCIKRGVLFAPFAFLVQGPGEHCLRTCQIVGHPKLQFPLFAARVPMLQTRELWHEALVEDVRDPDVCERYGMPLMRRIRDALLWSGVLGQQLEVLHEILRSSEVLMHKFFRVSLMLGMYEVAQSILVSCALTSNMFFSNMLMSALFGSRENEAAVAAAATRLIHAGMFEQAIDLLLVCDNWVMAIQEHIDKQNLSEAALFTRVQQESEAKTQCLHLLAALFHKQGDIGFEMLLLSEAKDVDAIQRLLFEINENEQADAVARVLERH